MRLTETSSVEKRLRILLLGPLPPPFAGPEVMTEALVSGLRRRQEFRVSHLNTQVSGSNAEKGGDKHQLRKSLRGAYQMAQMLWRLFSFRPDIVYLPMTNSPSFRGFLRDSAFMLATLCMGKKVAIHMHSGYYFYVHTKGVMYTFVRALLKRVSLAMVLGQRLTTVFNGLVGLERIVVIPNGVDDTPILEARDRDNPQSGVTKRILFVGIMCPEKGVRDIVAAIPLIPEDHFIFAGEWSSAEFEKEIRYFVHQNGMEDRVTFAGVVSGPAKYQLFVSADIFVLPSHAEGHPVSSVEALAAGLPIICTDHGALNESVRDGWNGFFVPKSDPTAIARRLNQLLSDDDLRRTMGERSRQLYEERFTLSQFLENWSRAIQRCAADLEVAEQR